MNNKGFMLVEIIVTFALALVIAYFLIDITFDMLNKKNDAFFSSKVQLNVSLLEKEVLEVINDKKISNVTYNNDNDNALVSLYTTDNKVYGLRIKRLEKEIIFGEMVDNTFTSDVYQKQFASDISFKEIIINNYCYGSYEDVSGICKKNNELSSNLVNNGLLEVRVVIDNLYLEDNYDIIFGFNYIST